MHMQERREREERELAAHRERERIRAGKELAKAKQLEDEVAMKRLIEVCDRGLQCVHCTLVALKGQYPSRHCCRVMVGGAVCTVLGAGC